MAIVQGVDELLNFLIEKVSLCGKQGASKDDIHQWTSDFYHSDRNGIKSSSLLSPQDTPQPMSVDDAFTSHVLEWLGASPHAKVVYADVANIAPRDSASSSTNLQKNYEPPTETSGVNNAKPNGGVQSNVRVYASEDRQWRAITGHGVNNTRLRDMEFQILSIIAAHGEKGVLQPDLINLSGQDKRSLPARTDSLHRYGYIEKEVVLPAGKKTSLCTLRKFVKPSFGANSSDRADNRLNYTNVFQDNYFRPMKFLDAAMELVEYYDIIDFAELCRRIGADSAFRTKQVQRYSQNLARTGCVNLLNIKKDILSTTSKIHPKYIQFIRRASKQTRQAFGTFANPKAEELDAGNLKPVDPEDDEANSGNAKVNDSENGNNSMEYRADHINDNNFAQLEWDPDRSFQNQAYDFVMRSGTRGVSSKDVSERLLGSFWKKPQEHLLAHLTDFWQAAQPDSLRHLAIVRDTAQSGKSNHYVYRTHDNFGAAAVSGDTSWEAVLGGPKNASLYLKSLERHALQDANDSIQLNNHNKKKGGRPAKNAAVTSVKVRQKRAVGIEEHDATASFLQEQPDPKRVRIVGPEVTSNDGAVVYCQETESLGAPDSFVAHDVEEAMEVTQDMHESAARNHESEETLKRPRVGELSPGLYINPPDRKRAYTNRGRPPKAKLAVIRTNLLYSLEWFPKYAVHSNETRNPSEGQIISMMALERSSRAERRSVEASPGHETFVNASKTPVQIPNTGFRNIDSPTIVVDEDYVSRTPNPPRLAREDVPSNLSGLKPYTRRPLKEKRAGVTLSGGSKDYRRSKIILKIVEHAGGVFPGNREMWYPFVTAMRRQEPSYKPDSHTVSRAVGNVVATGKINRQTFAFQDTSGVSRTRDILYLPHIHPTSEKLKEVKDEIAKKYPQPHLPEGVEVDASLIPPVTAVLNDKAPKTVYKPLKARQVQRSEAANEQRNTPAWQAWATSNKGEGHGFPTLAKYKKKRSKRSTMDHLFDSDDNDDAVIPTEQQQLQSTWQLPRLMPYPYEYAGKKSRSPTARKGSLGTRRPEFHMYNTNDKQSGGEASEPQLDQSLPFVDSPVDNNAQPQIIGLFRSLSIMNERSRQQLIFPIQPFHKPTGTFSTSFYFNRESRPRLKIRPHLARDFDTRMPHSVHDIIRQQPMTPTKHRTTSDNHLESEFEKVMEWEFRNTEDLSTMQLAETRFINHSFSIAEASRVPWKGTSPRMKHISSTRKRYPVKSNTSAPRAREDAIGETGASTEHSTRAEFRDIGQISRPRSPSTYAPRESKLTNQFSDAELKRFVIAVTVIRTLSGGLHKIIEWHIVRNICSLAKDKDDRYLRQKWTQVKRLHREEIDSLESDFHSAYLTAYEEGLIPPINFDDLENYNWKAVVEWVEAGIKAKGSPISYVQPTVNQSDSYEEEGAYDFPREDLYKPQITGLRRNELINDAAFSVPLRLHKRSETESQQDELRSVKSYILANVITPEAAYSTTATANKLRSLGEKRVEEALEQLKRSNTVRHANKGRAVPGRNYVLTDQYFRTFRTASRPMSAMFCTAARYKRVLDHDFQAQGYHDHSYHAPNGEMLALYNLLAHNHVRVEACLPVFTTDPSVNPNVTEDINVASQDPRRVLSIWGFTHGNYTTKKMEKSNVMFPLRVTPTSNYTRGIPLLSALPPPPVTPADRPTFCLWTDINNQTVASKWTMILASVLNTIAFRPGITTRLLSQTFKEEVSEEDLRLVKRWLEEAGMVQRNTWILTEWFWGVFGAQAAVSRHGADDDVWYEDV